MLPTDDLALWIIAGSVDQHGNRQIMEAHVLIGYDHDVPVVVMSKVVEQTRLFH